jgi:hypothetical protein
MSLQSVEEEYLDKNIRNIIEPLIASLLMDKPKEPVKT